MVTTAEKPQRQHAWVRIAFPASVILNIFLVALVVGHILHRAGYGRDDSSIPPMARALANAEASLSPSDASVFGSIIRSNKPGYIQAILEFAQARDRLGKQITTEPFDPAAVNEALLVWRQSWNHFLDEFDDTLVEALGKISPDGRRRLIEQRKKGFIRPLD